MSGKTSPERDAERERDDLAAAIKPLMGTINYYIGPSARTLVSHESEQSYWRLSLVLNRAMGEPCPRCHDTGDDRRFTGPHPCELRHEPGHLVPIPPHVIEHMIALRDKDRAEDATPYDERKGIRVGPPRYEAELDAMGYR